MGSYINRNSKGEKLGNSYSEKIHNLISDGAERVSGNDYLSNMICVVDNGIFAAAGYMYSQREYEAFKEPDGRPKTWLIHPLAEKLVD